MFEKFRQLLPGGEVCQDYEPVVAAGSPETPVGQQQQPPPPAAKASYVSIHNSRGFIGYVDAPTPATATLTSFAERQKRKAQLLAVRPEDIAAVHTAIQGELGQVQHHLPPNADAGPSSVAKPPAVAKRLKLKFRRRCERCGKKFREFVPWLHHDCLIRPDGSSLPTCKICGKEYTEERALFGHCSANLGGFKFI